MLKKNIFIICLIISLSLTLIGHKNIEKKGLEETLKKLYPNKKFNYFLCENIVTALNEGNIYLLSNDFSSQRGFRGVTNCLIELKPNGEIINVSIVDSEDSLSYINRIKKSPFLSWFKNKNSKNIDTIDIISGATLTTQAIKDDIKKSLKDYDLMDLKIINNKIESDKHKIKEIKTK